MAENLRAADLMLTNMWTILGDESLGAALRNLVELQAEAGVPNALGVVDAEGEYLGLLTSRLLVRSLLARWTPEDSVCGDEVELNQSLLQVVRDQLQLRVGDTVIEGIATVEPAARLLQVIETGGEQRLEFVPVVEAGRLLGLIPVTALFQATADLVLTPEHEGIRFEPEP